MRGRYRILFGLIVALATTVSGQFATLRVASATPQDPAIGPHAADEARHQNLGLRFAPATGPLIARQPRTGSSRTAGPATVQSPRLLKEVLGFATYWELSNSPNWNYSLLSTVAYFGININADGSLNMTDAGWSGWQSQNLANIINGAHQAGDRVVLVIKPSAPTAQTVNDIVTSPTATQAAITNTIAAVQSKKLDGVNVDFEGTSTGYPNVQSGFTNFMTQLSQQMHQQVAGSYVTVDTYGGSASWDGGIFKIGDLAPVVDGMFIMAYDAAFSNTSGRAGPNAPLRGPWTYTDTVDVSQYLTKAPSSKVILGVPYYGWKWSTTTGDAYGSVVPGSSALADTYASVFTDFACAQQLTRFWDATAEEPWASWYSPSSGDPCGGNYGAWRELYYEDAPALGLKYDLVNSANLQGTGMWALGYDGTLPDLWNELAAKFQVSYPFKAMYTVDAFGGVHPDASSPAVSTTGYWANWRIVRSAALLPDASGGYVLDGYGGLHPFGHASTVSTAYFGWNIARDIALLPAATTDQPLGYTLDGWGGIHAFGGAVPVTIAAYFPHNDIAKRMVLLADGTGGYVLDGRGGIHPFAIGANALPAAITNSAYFGFSIARDFALVPGSTATSVSGFTLDGWGGLHPFTSTALPAQPGDYPYFPGLDIARALRMSPTSTPASPQGWILDGYGRVHPFGGAPRISPSPYWPGTDVGLQLILS